MTTALVTGSAGFIGSHVAAALTAEGYSVLGIDHADPHPLDARDYFRHSAGRFDLVVHSAAVVGGRKVIDWTPIRHAVNLELDAALFAWAERTRPGRVVYFSSSCAYPAWLGSTGRVLAETDIDLARPQWPDGLYGWAKLTGELLAATAREAGVPVTVVRPFSVYGPGVKEGFAVRGFCDQARTRADPFIIWGDDSQVRDYIDVRDVAAAVLALAAAGVDGPVNLGTGQGTSLRDLAGQVCAAAGYAPDIKVDGAMPAGYPSLVADVARLRQHFTPARQLDGYLREAVTGG
jgi:nucleoside-diphosphate-sugar epimerase